MLAAAARPASTVLTLQTDPIPGYPGKSYWVLDVVVSGPNITTSTTTTTLSGTVTDETHVEDVYIFVSNRRAKIDGRKVFYRSNRTSAQQASMKFDTEIPLWPGANHITVIAREKSDVRTMRQFYVLREGAAATVATPSPPAVTTP